MDPVSASIFGGIIAGVLGGMKLMDKFVFERNGKNGSARQVELLEEIRDNTRAMLDLSKDGARDHKSMAGQLARLEEKR